MRLLYGITVAGSAETLLRGQLGWFRSRGWDVHVATSPGPLLDVVRDREEVVVHRLPMEREMAPAHDLRALARWTGLLRRLRPDVVNVGTPKAALLGCLAAWLTRVPARVYVMRGLRLEAAGSRPTRVVLWLAERLTIALATDVVCVSHSLRDEAVARRLFGRTDHPLVLGKGSSNGVDPDRWDPDLAAVDREAVRQGWRVGPAELVVGFVGRLTLDKGVDTLLAAVAELPDLPLRLLLVGSLDDPLLEPAIRALGDRVVRIEETDDVASAYAGMDVLCLPTRREGLPNVVLEAALAELPAITTTATGARDAVVDGVTGWLVPPGDAGALSAAIRACAASPDRARELGRAARARALADFDPQTIWRGLESVYLARLEAAHRPHGRWPGRGPAA
ncbi:Capsular polysaccharide biosynthesis glycosyl transferase [Modestobacter italicus]|uniref:Capsular polysaccharide biosynthesis glycosyl transferase n=1 Tax=Modestobacter italicus (strain DSM 44449 / CECT 9708 / BC 501) TaxID=2732864 RepID=I4EXJ7_MODI5|nr:Capsular polysaccharide biosynthesis glycosyl transferase [Modestobacter marinus]